MRLDANGNPPTMERAAVVTGMDLPIRGLLVGMSRSNPRRARREPSHPSVVATPADRSRHLCRHAASIDNQLDLERWTSALAGSAVAAARQGDPPMRHRSAARSRTSDRHVVRRGRWQRGNEKQRTTMNRLNTGRNKPPASSARADTPANAAGVVAARLVGLLTPSDPGRVTPGLSRGETSGTSSTRRATWRPLAAAESAALARQCSSRGSSRAERCWSAVLSKPVPRRRAFAGGVVECVENAPSSAACGSDDSPARCHRRGDTAPGQGSDLLGRTPVRGAGVRRTRPAVEPLTGSVGPHSHLTPAVGVRALR